MNLLVNLCLFFIFLTAAFPSAPAPLARCTELYFDHHPPLWVDLLMKWTYQRPAALILQYSWKLIDTLAPCWVFSGFHITPPPPPAAAPSESPSWWQSIWTDQREGLPRQRYWFHPPPQAGYEVNSVLTYEKQIAHRVITHWRNR